MKNGVKTVFFVKMANWETPSWKDSRRATFVCNIKSSAFPAEKRKCGAAPSGGAALFYACVVIFNCPMCSERLPSAASCTER